MPDNNVNILGGERCCNNNGILGSSNDCEILLFLIIFLLLFTNFGCGCCRG